MSYSFEYSACHAQLTEKEERREGKRERERVRAVLAGLASWFYSTRAKFTTNRLFNGTARFLT